MRGAPDEIQFIIIQESFKRESLSTDGLRLFIAISHFPRSICMGGLKGQLLFSIILVKQVGSVILCNITGFASMMSLLGKRK